MALVAAGAVAVAPLAVAEAGDGAAHTSASADPVAGHGAPLPGPRVRHVRSASIKMVASALSVAPPPPWPAAARRLERAPDGLTASLPSASPRASRAPPRA